MRREIEAAQALGGSPHVMPVLDHSPGHDWFVMPLADESAATARAALSETTELRALVTAMCEGLRHAHAIGWIHRDLKPANLLRRGGTWMVADWGLVRRPLGTTSQSGRTRLGIAFGTVGFGAPELSPDPHQAGPPADIYSIGQVIGWAVTGQVPQANTPLIPPGGPWRQVVRTATQRDPARRPATVDALLELVAEELDYARPDSGEAARALGARARDRDLHADQAAQITTLLHWIQARTCDSKDLELLDGAPAADDARAVFGRCLGLARRFAAHFPEPDGAELLRQVRASYPDIRAALEYASRGELGPAARGTGAASLAVALADFWRADGQLKQGRYWLRRSADNCPYPSRELAQALIVRGQLGTMAGEARDAVADIREGIRIASGLGDRSVSAHGYRQLTQALTFAEYYEEAAAAGTEAYRLLRHLDDSGGGLRLQTELAALETLAGSPQQAVARCENALGKVPAPAGWIRGRLHAALAFARFQQPGRRPGREAECGVSARGALRVYQEFGDRTGIAFMLELLGWLAARLERHTRAAWLLGAAGTLWEAAGCRLSNVPTMEELHANAVAAARGVLGEQRFEGIQAMGADSPLTEVIAFAAGDLSVQVVS
jgi:hypothetical protein